MKLTHPHPRPKRAPRRQASTLSAYDPALPTDGSLIIASELRDQFQGLAALIAAVPAGPPGPQGPPGEVTLSEMNTAIAGAIDQALQSTSANSNTVSPLGIAISDPPTQGEVQNILSTLNDLIYALRRN